MKLKKFSILLFMGLLVLSIFSIIPIGYSENSDTKEIWGWWLREPLLNSTFVDWLKDMHFNGLCLQIAHLGWGEGWALNESEATSAIELLVNNNMIWSMMVHPVNTTYDEYVSRFTQLKNKWDNKAEPPKYYVLDDFQCYVDWGSVDAVISAADSVFTQNRWVANYNLELFNPHPHTERPDLYIKHLDYYDTPVNTVEWLSYEIDNNFNHSTVGAMVWTCDDYGCGWNQVTSSQIATLYDKIVDEGCIRLSFWCFYQNHFNESLYNFPEWWDTIRSMNTYFLTGKTDDSDNGNGWMAGEGDVLFRPFYEGYGKGTKQFWGYSWLPTLNDKGITREWNLEAWEIEQLKVTVRWCFVAPWLFDEVKHTFDIFCNVSLDNGETWTEDFTIWGTAHTKRHGKWGDWDYVDQTYYFYPEQYSLFTPTTRINFKVKIPSYTYRHIALAYWGEGQQPIPPHDWIDGDGNYIQWYILFNVKYKEEKIEYTGTTLNFTDYPSTRNKLTQAATMIQNCMHPSGATNEVVNKKWGREIWAIIYSDQLAMMELIDLCQVFPDRHEYLVSAKRFIAWMWSKQNLTDGSFPFILTDGDQHPYYNETKGHWYGYDKIDAFSASAISLMKKYYDATEDTAYVNNYWTQILKCKDFIYDLMNLTLWLPVDGYHYNGTHYTKSTSNWLHDTCEAYQGLKDLAWLYGNVKNNTAEETYWNNFANSIASSIREKMWNETLHRYIGMYHLNNETQDPVLVYNIITPLIYGIETNVTRAYLTLQQYVAWGIMSGRYLNREWAPDYSVYNEYSTMSGMIFSALAELNHIFHYYNDWMYSCFNNVTYFLFENPVYPYNQGNLQNANGFLDWVNLVNKTWVKDWARLIETSAWFIDGFMKLPYLDKLFKEYIDEDWVPWWEEDWWKKHPSIWLPLIFIFGMFGIVSTIGGAMYSASLLKKRKYDKGLTYGIIWVSLGVCLVLAWLWG